MIEAILEEAVERRASDIHFEPIGDVGQIRMRIDGRLQMIRELSRDELQLLVAQTKVRARMDIAEKRLPQDGSFGDKVAGERIDFRVSSLPTVEGEKLVLRLFCHQPVFKSLIDLGLDGPTERRLRRLIRRPYGMVIVTGPAGSGKTTTLYTMLQELSQNGQDKNIVTLEDPVEYRIKGFNQVEINPKSGLTFSVGLRSILRQDPNVIMLGEMRDLESAEMAVRIALTGHLLLTTLHTSDAIGAIFRLLEMGIPPYMITSAVTGVVAQRLIRKICLFCVSKQDKQSCPYCRGTGYYGRTGVFELLLMHPELSRLIVRRATANEIREEAVKHGWVPLHRRLEDKLRKGETTKAEVAEWMDVIPEEGGPNALDRTAVVDV